MKKTLVRGSRGFSLVELMIAIVLGLVVMGGVISIFVANRQAFRVSENMAHVQENARVAFELLARDLREAGGNPCGTRQIANTLNNSANLWWANWAAGSVRGFENSAGGDLATAIVPVGGATGNRVATTDAILLINGTAIEGLNISSHDPVAAQFKLNLNNPGINTGDVIVACDAYSAAIFQVTNANQANGTIVHNAGGGVPGNCTKGLGFPTLCTPDGTGKTFENGGFIVRLSSAFWYIGNNDRGGRSLFRTSVSGTAVPQTDEIVEGVQDMQLEYLTQDNAGVLAPNYVLANTIASWAQGAFPRVTAVRMRITFVSNEAVGTNQQVLSRTFIDVVDLRNL